MRISKVYNKGGFGVGFEQPSSIVFSIKEAVWLTRGKEIAELYSLALEPDISIREDGDHVFVRGNLHLFGEFLPKEREAGYDRSDYQHLSEELSFRSIEEVIMTDDGVGLIRHSFPLDVTIPRERVTNLNDVFVTVDSFDYELPGGGCIELEASVTIVGIQDVRNDSSIEDDYSEYDEDEEASFDEEEEYHMEESSPSSFQSSDEENQEDDRTFYFEQYRHTDRLQGESEEVAKFYQEYNEATGNVEEIDDGVHNINEPNQSSDDNKTFKFESSLEADGNFRSEEEEHQDDKNLRRDSPLYENEANENEPVTDEWEESVDESKESGRFEPAVHFLSQKKLSDSIAETDSYLEVEEEEEEDEETTTHEENALYLTKMLTKGEEEFSRLKICIVQEGETLETIAKRYELSASQLLRVNRLNEDQIAEGQILYIPARKSPSIES